MPELHRLYLDHLTFPYLAGFEYTELGYGVAFAIRKNTYLNPAMKIVIASETKQSRLFQGDCHVVPKAFGTPHKDSKADSMLHLSWRAK
jgi:hypothetical protein